MDYARYESPSEMFQSLIFNTFNDDGILIGWIELLSFLFARHKMGYIK